MRRFLILSALVSQEPLLAQTCDSLTIDSLMYAPFGDGLHVSLHNGSSQMLSGPMLDLFEVDGDTISLNAFNFFAIGPGWTQVNQLPLSIGATLPTSPFTGSLVLSYSDMEGGHTCVFPLENMDLCPAPPCAPLAVFTYLQGGAVETDLDWSVSDAENITQATGTLYVDTLGFGYTIAEICLPPGNYTLHMQQAIPAGNIIHVGVTQADLAWNDGTNALLPIGGSVDLPFNFYELCFDDAQGVTAHEEGGLRTLLEGRTLQVLSGDGSALGLLFLLDGTGRTVRSLSAHADRASCDLSDLAAGTYVIIANTESGRVTQRFILQ